MDELSAFLQQIVAAGCFKAVLSKPAAKGRQFKKIAAERKERFWQFSKYTEKQVFHENVPLEEFAKGCERLFWGQFLQVNAWNGEKEFILLTSAKGRCTVKTRNLQISPSSTAHNRQKQYALENGIVIPPLVDLGVITKEGKIVQSMYDKYRQINRYLEIIEDGLAVLPGKQVNLIDFGCGKSYLTFIVYYYLTQVKGLDAHVIGLDLKEDVIRTCNQAAEKYGYKNLSFQLGDINGFEAPLKVDMVMTLHACDTATDYALFNAIRWKAKLIFSVPCCQHELNQQVQSEELSLLTRYGIVKERFSALATDAIRGNLLEYCGYKTQLLEFIDFSHTPKNILIRGIYRPGSSCRKEQCLAEVERLMEQFHFMPTLYRLLFPEKGASLAD